MCEVGAKRDNLMGFSDSSSFSFALVLSIESVDSTSGLDQLEEFMGNAERPQMTPTGVVSRAAEKAGGPPRSQPRPGSAGGAGGGSRSAGRRVAESKVGINDAQYLQQLIARGISCNNLVLRAISNTVPSSPSFSSAADPRDPVTDHASSAKEDEGRTNSDSNHRYRPNFFSWVVASSQT
jgi:hypothetical protein